MPKTKTSAAFLSAVVGWTLVVVLIIVSLLLRRKISYLSEENKYLFTWIENRHGSDWAQRIKEWSHQKATGQQQIINGQ